MPYGDRTIWIGFDDREVLSYAVARESFTSWSNGSIPVHGVVLHELKARGWYTRPYETRHTKQGGAVLWDMISDAAMSTQFAVSRFFVPKLARNHYSGNRGWALFVDSDVLVRSYIDRLFFHAEQQPGKALLCVPHNHEVVDGSAKKEHQVQSSYPRKNWSSVMLFNLAHPANDRLTDDLLNTLPGRDLHRFCWLEDDEIGFLDQKWNHLAGVEGCRSPDPAIVHFTNGGPWLRDYADVEYADEWFAAMRRWVK